MKILLVNKFLYHKGGAETYIIKLGQYLKDKGHEVEYFGLEDQRNILTNKYNLYVKNFDLTKNNLRNVLSFFKLIYSKEAKHKMYRLLKEFKPDLIILNNIEFYLTPSIIIAIKKYKNKKNTNTKLFYVAHDYQLICPSHGLFDSNTNLCEKCLQGNYWECFKTKCLKESKLKSLIGSIDSSYWYKKKIYENVDKIICPSQFIKNKLDTKEILKTRTVMMRNFVENIENEQYKKEDYIIYFGRFSKDKGIETLLKVVSELQNIQFVFAGYGPLENKITKYKNVKCVGFKTGKELQQIVSKARISIYPSEWYENCPFSIIESQMLGTPVIGSNLGGIPELIDTGKTGEIFEAKNAQELKNKILYLWSNKEKLNEYSKNCINKENETLEKYTSKIFKMYNELNAVKIIQVGTGYTSIPATNGAATEIVVEELAKVFQKEDIDYEIFDIQDKNRQFTELKINEVKIPRLFRKKDISLGITHKLKRVIYSIRLAKKLKREIKKSNKNLVIHFHNQYNMFFFCKSISKRIRKKVKIIYTVHSYIWNGEWEDIKEKIYKNYFQEIFCIKNADKVFVLNDITKQHVINNFSIDSNKVVRVDNGVNIETYKPCNMNKKENIFLQCGSICDRKNQLEAIKMLTNYLKENKDFKYIYAGGIIDKEYKNKIDEYILENNIQDQIEYVGELHPGKELREYYNKAKALIISSKQEAFGLVTLEAIASGLPVIINKREKMEIDKKLNEVVLFYSNEQSFNEIIKNKILNEDTRNKIAIKSRKIAEEVFNWDKVAKKYLDNIK